MDGDDDDDHNCHYCAHQPFARVSDRRRHEKTSCKGRKNLPKVTCEFCKVEVSRMDAVKRHYLISCREITREMLNEWGVHDRGEAGATGHFMHWSA